MDDFAANRVERRVMLASKYLPSLPPSLVELHQSIKNAKHAQVKETLLLLFIAIGLVVSTALAGEYLFVPRLCNHDSGCDKVRHSSFSSLLGIPTPLVGIGYYFATLICMMVKRLRTMFFLPLCLAGGVAGIGFLLIQAFIVGAFCYLCVTVDLISIAIAVTGWHFRHTSLPKRSRLQRAFILFGSAGLCLAVLFTHVVLLDSNHIYYLSVPEEIAKEQASAPPGVVSIIEFADFHCSHCKAQYPQTAAVLMEFGDSVRFVLKHAPRAEHKYTLAARTHICAERIGPPGAAERVAATLFRSPTTPIDTIGCMDACQDPKTGQPWVVDEETLSNCTHSKETTAVLKEHWELGAKLNVATVPTFYIGNEKLIGVTSTDDLTAAILRTMEIMKKKTK